MTKTGQLRMMIGIWHAEERLSLDGFFLTHSHIGLGDNSLKPWNEFFCIAQQNGVSLLTLDQITDFNQIDAFLFIDCPDFSHPLVRKVFEVDKPRYLITYESEVVKPENWQPATYALFDRVFTWDDRLINHTKFIKIHHAQNFDDRPVYVPKDKFCTLVASARTSSHPSELYSERVRAIRWFETNQPKMFDLYGIGWDAASFPSYRGRADKTLDILQRYKFAICYENTNYFPGYITEKIFDCFKARCLPIYLGAPNIDEYIPPTCFIDRRTFESYECLYAFIAGMSEAECKIYLENIERFLETVYPYQYSGDGHQYYYRFASEHFIWTILGQLLRDRGEQLKTNPLVSAVIPTYNYGRFIDKAITSVIAQNMQDLEVIVLDNASTDDTEYRVASYLSDKRIRYVRHPSNIGAFNNGQRGIQMALGKYVVVLSSDDFLLSGHLQTLVSALEANTKCVLAYAPCVWVDDDDKVIRVLNHPGHWPDNYCGGRDELSALLVYDCYITLSAAVIRRSALDEVGPTDPYLWSCGDWDLWVRLAMKHGDFAFSKKPSVCYRVHGDQQSHGLYRTIHPLTDCMRIIEKVLASDQAWRLAPHIPAVKKLLRYRFDAYPCEMTRDLVARMEAIEKRLVLIQQGEVRAECHPDMCVREPSQGTWKMQDGSEAIENTPNRLEDKQGTGMTPMVSVIVPTYNRPDTLITALRSILNQTYQNFEIIVVNDGGSDIENIVRFLDKEGRITYIRHGSNRDRAAARNTAIRVARGKYIAYLDDDDIYYPDHLETLMGYLQKTGLKVAYTDALRAHQEKQDGRYVVTKRDLPYSFDFDYDRILVHNFIPILCLMHEKGCLDVVGLFDESLTTHEDWDLLIRLSKRFQITHIKKVTCEFVSRTDGSTTTSAKLPDFRRTMAIVLERHMASASEKPHVRAAQERILHRLQGGSDGAHVVTQPTESQRIAALLQQADTHCKAGDLQGAKEILGQAIDILPDNPQLLVTLGNVVLRLGDVEGARREFVKATALCPDYAPAHADLAAVLMHLGRLAEAETSAMRALELDSTNISALKVLAKICLDTERYQEAVQTYVTILGHAPNDIETLILVGNCYAETGRAEDAKTFYRRVLQLEPDHAIAAENLAAVNGQQSSATRTSSVVGEAIESERRNVSLDTWDDQSPYARVETLADAPSVRREKVSRESDPADKVTEALRCAEAYLRDENLDAAGQVLTEALTQTPDNPDLIVALGHVAWKQGDLEKAGLQFVRAVTLKQDHAQAHAALAILFLQQSRFAEAEEAAQKALAINATEVTALKVLAKICLDTERYQEAVQTYATILQHAPNDIETLILVGNCYAETGRFEQARGFYQRVLALDLSNAVAADNLAEVNRLASAADRTTSEPTAPAASEGFASVSIVIVTYNSASTIRACLDSILSETKPVTDLIVVDNLSTDETRSILRGYQGRIATILNPDNIGFSAACNQGIRASAGQHVVLLNPDTVVTSGWLERLLSHAFAGVGAVGPVSDYVAGLQKLHLYLPTHRPATMTLAELADLLGGVNQGKAVETKLLIGFCMLVPRKVLDEVGLLDEDLFLGNDDLDLSWRLRLRGYRLLVATDAFVHHEGQVSFKSEAETKTSRLVQESTDRLYANLVTHYGPGNVPSPMELWGIDWFKPTAASFRVRAKTMGGQLTSIIILTHNGIDHTRKCLASIEAHTPEPHELVIVDNGSSDDTLDFLRNYMAEHDNVRVVANRSNRGFAAGNNQGLALARGDYLLLLNNDTIVTTGWLQRMLQVFLAHPDVGIVGPMSNYVSGPQLVREVSYKGPEGLEAFAVKWTQGHDGQSAEATRVVGFCLLTRKEVIARIGGLDEQFGSGNFEDDDFCIRAFQVGFRARIALDAFIHHTGSQTFKSAKIDYRQSLMRNWELFKAKWDIPADAPYEKGYRFPAQTARESNLSIPLPDVGADHWCEDQGHWWQETCGEPVERIDKVVSQAQPAVTGEAPLSVVIVSNGHGLAPLWPSLVQHAKHPLAITILPSHGNGNGAEPAHEAVCPDGWRIGTSNLPTVRLLNQLLESVHDDPVILLSSDLILTPGWLKRLLAAFDRDRRIAVVGPTLNQGPATQRVKADYKGTGKALRQFALRRAHRYGEKLAEVDNLAPFCTIFKGSTCRAVGPLREDLDLSTSLHDYFARLRQTGCTVAVALDAYVHYEPPADLPSRGPRRADADP